MGYHSLFLLGTSGRVADPSRRGKPGQAGPPDRPGRKQTAPPFCWAASAGDTVMGRKGDPAVDTGV